MGVVIFEIAKRFQKSPHPLHSVAAKSRPAIPG
jgi:hypothetical protein